MTDPVVLLADQQTYERSAILGWLEDHYTSPVTGEALMSKDIVPNYTLRSILAKLAELRT